MLFCSCSHHSKLGDKDAPAVKSQTSRRMFAHLECCVLPFLCILNRRCLFCLQATQGCQLAAEDSSTDSTTPDDHATNVVKGVGAAALFLEALLVGLL